MAWQHPATALTEADRRIAEIEAQIDGLEAQISELRRSTAKETVPDYDLDAADGSRTSLSRLFGDKSELILVHNMGKSCPYCTMWADGFNAVLPHVVERAAFALLSPDAPDAQREFAHARGWSFPVISGQGASINRDLGFEDDEGRAYPGVTTLRKREDGTIERYGAAPFGPGDKFCSVFSFFEMLPPEPADAPDN